MRPLLILLVFLTWLSLVPETQARSFSWYFSGAENSNASCWQEGSPSPAPSGVATPAVPSMGCHTIDLPTHTVGGRGAVGGGVGADLPLPPGDYCNYYRIGDDLGPDPNNESGWTGFAPTLGPLSSYQMGDGVGNVCQATGDKWGHAVSTNVPGNSCFDFCGVHHYASVNSSLIENRPWDAWFGDPSLVVSTEVNLHALTAQKPSSAWGYLCPVLEDTTSGWTIEYCIQEWRSNYNEAQNPSPTWCGTGSGSNDQIIATLPSGSGQANWASMFPGSAPTFNISAQPSGWTRITAYIQVPQLENAVRQLHSTCAPSPLSMDPRDYRLLGIEQGLEVGGTSFAVGEATRGLHLYTIYTFSNAPSNATLPSIGGSPTVGTPAHTDPGSWTNASAFAYQWNRCQYPQLSCAPIPGADEPTYVPSGDDVGSRLTITMAAGREVAGTSNLAWSRPATSAPSDVVGPSSSGASSFTTEAAAGDLLRPKAEEPRVLCLRRANGRVYRTRPRGCRLQRSKEAVGRSTYRLVHLKWLRWDARMAKAMGQLWIYGRSPGEEKYPSRAVEVELRAARRSCGGFFYRRVIVREVRSGEEVDFSVGPSRCLTPES